MLAHRQGCWPNIETTQVRALYLLLRLVDLNPVEGSGPELNQHPANKGHCFDACIIRQSTCTQVHPMLCQCLATVFDAGPTLTQH